MGTFTEQIDNLKAIHKDLFPVQFTRWQQQYCNRYCLMLEARSEKIQCQRHQHSTGSFGHLNSKIVRRFGTYHRHTLKVSTFTQGRHDHGNTSKTDNCAHTTVLVYNKSLSPSVNDFSELASKRYRRYLERIWCRNPTAINRSRLTTQTHLCNRQMSKAISAHYSKIIAELFGDHGSLWKAFNKILRRCPKIHLPDHSSIATLASTFSSFFMNKISVIRSSFPSDSHSRVLNPPDTRKVLQNPSCVSADEVSQLVLWAPCKSSDLDQIPTSLVKDCIDILITPITSIINLSLTEGSFPSHFLLSSNNDNSLSVPRVKTNTGARAFHSCAPSLWSNLPLSVH